jgi:hypothetical protein
VASADLNQCLAVPGALCINPTDLTLPFPHGGTALGEVYMARAAFTSGYFDVTAEEYGNRVVESVYSGENIAFGAILRQWDEAAVGAVFPNTATGAKSQRVSVKGWEDAASPVRPGHLASSRSVKLLFTPTDSDRCRAVMLYRALPRVAEAVDLRFAINARQEIPVLFLAIPDATGRCWRIDFLRDLAV